MYRALIVDDEMPALRFVTRIIEQFCLNFQVSGALSSGEQALDFLKSSPVDLLITDISMHGMTGIELAQAARKMLPAIHIVIISGYGEFEYAQGAIQAGVDDYVLKPVSISKMTEILKKVEDRLDSERVSRAEVLLPRLACGQKCASEEIQLAFGKQDYRFAMIRWGNMDMILPRTLSATAVVLPHDDHFMVLRGRDDDERILISADCPFDEYLANLSVYMTKPGSLSTWCAVYTQSAKPMSSLSSFIEWALELEYRKTVIGKHQIIPFVGGQGKEPRMVLPAVELNQLSYFVSAGRYRMVKDYFASLAIKWEKEQTPQWQVWHMGRQLIHFIATISPTVSQGLEDVLSKFNEMIRCASSYGDLMASMYSFLFDSGSIKDRKLSTEELYEYAAGYIAQNYAQPLSMQDMCDEIGISQTYLSRLFRKYGDTTFSAYLTKCRMEAAMKLLKEKPDLLLRDVAACVGYDDSSYFTKVFHQYTGKTPSEFIAS